jgi:UDP-N-acetylmuramate dehydrogenase
MLVRENVDLHHLNTFHVIARCRWFAEVTSVDDLAGVLAWMHGRNLPFMLLGQGSNILFREDYPGLVIELCMKGIRQVEQTDDSVLVEAMAGEIWHPFVQHCLREGWYGLENLSLIPGTVGAAPVQNIGAYGVELKDVLHALQAVEIATGETVTFTNNDCDFSYRNSVFKGELRDQFIITSVTFRLSKVPRINLSYPALQDALRLTPAHEVTPQLVSDRVCEIRRSKLPDPDRLGNAGSFFWNPRISHQRFDKLKSRFPDMPGYAEGDNVKVPAAWLIEQAGWKGHREGDVGVHDRHALVLVNHGEATGAELVALSERIQDSVREQFGIELWPEVRIV